MFNNLIGSFMQTKVIVVSLLIISLSLAGCTTPNEEFETSESNSRINELESSQQELVIELTEQQQTNENLLASISMLESSYQGELELAYNAINESIEELESVHSSNIQNLSGTIENLSQAIVDLQNIIVELEHDMQNLRAINDFSYMNFKGAQLFNFNNGGGIQMDPPIYDFAILENASLTYSNFSDASFVNANLVGADGVFSTFHRTDFSGAQMYHGIWRNSDFSDALFVGTQLSYTEFSYSDLSGADLSGASIFGGSDWIGANLTNANLSNAWLYDIDLRYADLTGADLTGARLTYLNPSYGAADVTGVIWTNAICPDGIAASLVGDSCLNNLELIE